MDTGKAFDHAFAAGLKVRDEAARQVASASLVMHASRTLDAEPFLARGESLVAPAVESFQKTGRTDLELRVALWLADAGRKAEVSPAVDQARDGYRKARAWARGGGGVENLAWIRQVPSDGALAAIVGERLLDHALAAGDDARGPAEAVLEAALADFPRAAAYGRIFRAVALTGAPEAADRTLDGLGAAHPADDTPEGRRLLGELRAAVAVERFELSRAALEVAVQERRDDIVHASFAPHVAAALHRKLLDTDARALLEEARAAGAGGAAGRVAAAFVERQLAGARGPRDGTARSLLASTAPPAADALVAGACEAARAVRDAWPAVDVAVALTGDGLGPISSAATRAAFQKELFLVGGEAAAATGDREAVAAMARTLRTGGLAPGVQTFLRATLADAAAGAAARSGDAKAYDLALKLAGQTRDRFERAKMAGRVALEYVRSTEVPPMPVRWLDPRFAVGAPAKAPG